MTRVPGPRARPGGGGPTGTVTGRLSDSDDSEDSDHRDWHHAEDIASPGLSDSRAARPLLHFKFQIANGRTRTLARDDVLAMCVRAVGDLT